MKKKSTNIYNELVEKYKENSFTEKDILDELNEKPICVRINETISQYENEHRHEYYEILYVEKGKISYLIDHKEYTLNAGSLTLIPPGTIHKLLSFNDTDNSRFILLLSNKFLRKFSTKNTNLFNIFNNVKTTEEYVLKFAESSKIEFEKNLYTASNVMTEEEFGADLFYIQKVIKLLIIISSEHSSIEQKETLLNNTKYYFKNFY